MKNAENLKLFADKANFPEVFARFDGACDPNPFGHTACACLIEKNGREVFRKAMYLGTGQPLTCNVAEFSGLLMILEWLAANAPNVRTLIVSDSTVVVNRIRKGTLPHGFCRDTAEKCQQLMNRLPLVRVEWQRRNHNEECDAMCSHVIAEAKADYRSTWGADYVREPFLPYKERRKAEKAARRAAREKQPPVPPKVEATQELRIVGRLRISTPNRPTGVLTTNIPTKPVYSPPAR